MPKIVDKKKKSADIGQAALRVCRQLGYHRTRMADIAEAAGVGKGTLYEYFSSKDEILRFVFDRYFESFKAGAAEAMAGAHSPARRLLALVRFAFDHVAEWEDHCAVYVDYFGGARAGDDSWVSLSAIYDETGALLRALVEAAQQAGEISAEIDPVATAELLVSIFDGVVLHGVLTERGCDVSVQRELALRLLAQGLIRPEPLAGEARADGGGANETT
jgi:AcrR family transcriptional regulator